jgi:quinol monooxygenase YgiN
MIVVRFKVTCKPETADQTRAAFEAVVAPSRKVEGVLSFDIGRDVTNPHSFIATEVFMDKAALERQESLPEVQKIVGMLPELLAAEPEATVYNVSSSEPWG